jgi:hypothetical protein
MHTVSSLSDVLSSLPSDKSESGSVDFCRLTDKLSLATSKLAIRAVLALRFRGMAQEQ